MEKNWKEELKKLERTITAKKRTLIKKAKERGMIWEDFGQKEYRDITDKFGELLLTSEWDIRQRAWILVEEFRKWAQTYTLSS